MARYGILVNIDKCNGCYNCYMACRDEFTENDYLPYSAALPAEGKAFMKVVEKERGSVPKVKVDYIAIPCMQCIDAPCVNKSEDGSVYKRDDGIVIIDPEKAKGNKDIVNNCPHRLISWNEEKNVAQKCTFCAHLLDQGWKEPRCVEACPSGALVFGNLDDPNSEISKLIATSHSEEFNPSFRLRPSVRYIDLPKRFIAGEVVLGDKQDSCASGIKVVLSNGKNKFEFKTDSFGEFEFDGLEASRKYTLTVDHNGYKKTVREVITYSDLYIGVIELTPDKKSASKKKTGTGKKTESRKTVKKAVKKSTLKAAQKAVKKNVKKSTAKKTAAKKKAFKAAAVKTSAKKTAKKTRK